MEKNSMSNTYQKLLDRLKPYKKAAVAFSGGVDSTFLLAACKDALGEENVIGYIGRSPSYPQREMDEAVELAQTLNVPFEIIDTEELNNPDFASNPPTRCFHCKTTLFQKIKDRAAMINIEHIFEGSNGDDVGDFRPGMDAARKLNVIAPLRDLKITKNEIRTMSKEMGLGTWNKPAAACLSSRIPYGQDITIEKLGRIETAENFLKDLGYKHLRVRDHDTIARIEVPPDSIALLAESKTRVEIVEALKKAGYKYVTLDLEGYRTGAMNETLTHAEQQKARTQGR